MLMVDTVLLCGQTQSEEYCSFHGIPKIKCLLQPEYPKNINLANEQLIWIEETLKKSKSSYIIVNGHYPIWSIAEHGPTKCLVDSLRPLLIKYNVTAYMSGHDHTFEYIEENNYPNLGYIVTGGAHLCDKSTEHINNIPSKWLKFHGCSKGGFTRIHASNTLYFDIYYGDSKHVTYSTKHFLPRN